MSDRLHCFRRQTIALPLARTARAFFLLVTQCIRTQMNHAMVVRAFFTIQPAEMPIRFPRGTTAELSTFRQPGRFDVLSNKLARLRRARKGEPQISREHSP